MTTKTNNTHSSQFLPTVLEAHEILGRDLGIKESAQRAANKIKALENTLQEYQDELHSERCLTTRLNEDMKELRVENSKLKAQLKQSHKNRDSVEEDLRKAIERGNNLVRELHDVRALNNELRFRAGPTNRAAQRPAVNSKSVDKIIELLESIDERLEGLGRTQP